MSCGATWICVAAALLLSGCGACERERRAPTLGEPGATPTGESGRAPRADADPMPQLALPATPGSERGVPEREPLADGLPESVPRYPGALPLSARRLPDGALLAGFETRDAPETVFAELRDRLEGEGWSLEVSDDAGSHKLLRATRSGERVIVYVTSVEGVSHVLFRSDVPRSR